MTGKFVTYRSSAGSGKTYTLVKEYLKLALHSSSANYYKRILAITFTNKAASEMKERVIQQLTTFSKAKENGKFNAELLPKKDNDLLQDLVKEINNTYTFGTVDKLTLLQRADKTISHILHHFSDLSISTIDSFIHGIIRSFARDMNLDTEFEVALDQKKVMQTTIKNLLSDVGKNKDLTKLILKFVSSQIDDSKGWNIEEDLENFGKTIFSDSAQLELKKLEKISSSEFLKIRSKIYATQQKFEEELDDYGIRVTKLIEGAGLMAEDFSGQTIPKFFSQLKVQIIKAPDYFPTVTMQKMIAGEKDWIPQSKKSKAHLADNIRDEITQMYHDVLDILESDEMKKYQKRRFILKSFFNNTLLNSINEYTNQWKEETNTILVSDFNQMISKIVLNNPAPFIYEKIGEHYLHILIDEFQDTNILQWQNFLPLIENSLSKEKFNMVVGDPKQAIYRWRDGEVMQFVKLPEIYKPMTKNIASIGAILNYNYKDEQLDTNYRSSKEVIDFNNTLFKNIASHLGEYEEIYEGLKQEVGKEKSGLVTISYYSGREKEEKNEEQFKAIIEKITSALDDGYNQKDIAILCRKNDDGKTIAENILDREKVLNYSNPKNDNTISIIHQGLSVITSESLLLHVNVRIKVLIALAKITSNPEDEKSKVDLLTNLSKLNLLENSTHETLNQYKVVATEKRKKATINFPLFMKDNFPSYYNNNYKTQGIYEIIETFIRLFSFEKTADNYLEFFLHTIMADPTLSLVDFLNWWGENGEKLSVGESSGSEGIRILTVHKSKGLQFPVVIVPIKVNQPKKTNIWLSEDVEMNLPTALIQVNPSEKNNKISEEIKEEEDKILLDKINQLYVATTRPEDRLHLIIELPAKPNFDKFKHTYQFINGAISELPKETINDKNEVKIGERIKKVHLEKPNENLFLLEKYLSKSLNQGVEISFKKGDQWVKEDQPNDKDYGIVIHELLANKNIKSELSEEIIRMCNEGLITENIEKQVHKEITALLDKKELKKWYSSSGYITEKSEKELINADGKVLRPDKVVYFDDHIDVIDFKSGEKRNSHKYQVLEYVKEIEKTSEKQVKGFLVYTKTQEIVPVTDEAQLSMF